MAESSLDIEAPGALAEYLRASGRAAAEEVLEVTRLAGGVSNRTMLVASERGGRWVVKQGLAQLRVAVEWYADPVRVHREALAMQWLNRALPAGAVPALVFEDPAHHLLAMDCVPDPHENWKSLLLQGRVDSGHVRQFGTLLGQIHRSASEPGAELPPILRDRALFEALRLEPYYGFAATQLPAAAGFLQSLAAQARTRTDTLVHGDYSPKNVLVYQDRLVLLDHEVAHVGDAAFDLGFGLTHLLSKAHFLPPHRQRLAQAAEEFWQSYGTALGDVPWRQGLEERAVAHTLGCLLARVAGRSPLEYFQDQHRARQRDAVLAMIDLPPHTVAELISSYLNKV